MRRLPSLSVVVLAACGASEPTPAEHAQTQHGDRSGDADHQGHAEHPDHSGQGMQHSFADAERYARVFDAPERDAWQKPEAVVELLELSPGLHVVDVGAGTGYFLPHLAPAVAPGGSVVGVDIEPNMVAHMTDRIAREGIGGASARLAEPDDPGLRVASVDRVLVVDTWHHIGDRAAYAAKLRRGLRPGGFVLVVDFDLDSRRGPPRHHKLAPDVVVAELRGGGFGDVRVLDESLPDQYVVRAAP